MTASRDWVKTEGLLYEQKGKDRRGRWEDDTVQCRSLYRERGGAL
jgi:hypothetical protein